MEYTNVISFRVTKDEAEALETALQHLEIGKSEFAREAFLRGFIPAKQATEERKKAEDLRKRELLGMVRDTGFEPVTPTVSRKSSNLKKLPFYSPSQAPFLPPNVADSIMHGINVVADGTNHAVELSNGVSIEKKLDRYKSATLRRLPAVQATERSL